VDLLYLGLRLVLASVDRIERGPPSHDVVAIPSGPA